jgi:hypothetical protein
MASFFEKSLCGDAAPVERAFALTSFTELTEPEDFR